MKTVTKKIDTEWFEKIQTGEKDYELRLADFDIESGDIIRMEEWVSNNGERVPTGRFIEKKVNHVRKVDIGGWIKEQPELLEKGFYVIRF